MSLSVESKTILDIASISINNKPGPCPQCRLIQLLISKLCSSEGKDPKSEDPQHSEQLEEEVINDYTDQLEGNGSENSSSWRVSSLCDIDAEDENHSPAWCTQKCLLGLKSGTKLDPDFPNVKSHRWDLRNENHPLCRHTFRSILQAVLRAHPDKIWTPLKLGEKPGKLTACAKNTMFRITLPLFNYVLIAKANAEETPLMAQEFRIYRRLRFLQGVRIPVTLGLISTPDERPHTYDESSFRCITLLSYVGKGVSIENEAEYAEDVGQFRNNDLKQYNVSLDTVYRRNILWSEELNRVMFVDFERAEITAPFNNLEVGVRSLSTEERVLLLRDHDERIVRKLIAEVGTSQYTGAEILRKLCGEE
ncbi:uncharacterized protein KY384_002729 [Bacidia gigantensis]|uniref:uncharacterized protein n=1 Tax=Bacidia gigantensis TaxID=2732470 RepID=UPI001D048813|nr:uncharacterized protein KY384_002729 [Bacidia gigantensis]KAG8532851.1 hypothetical protein KY384_002729 [Bacidia gigantensis]